MKYLGHKVSQHGVLPDPANTAAITNFPVPTNPAALKSFLGMTGFYQKFIPNYADLTADLRHLATLFSRKKFTRKWLWNTEHQLKFDTLKKAMSSLPLLAHPDFTKEFILRVDGSKQGVGGLLAQLDDKGVEKVVAFCSKKLSRCERRWAPNEIEAYAMVWGIQHFHNYLYGREFKLETDHKNLLYVMKNDPNSSKVARWSVAVQGYRFHIVHVPGVENVVADCLSRYPAPSEACGSYYMRNHTDEYFPCSEISVGCVPHGITEFKGLREELGEGRWREEVDLGNIIPCDDPIALEQTRTCKKAKPMLPELAAATRDLGG
jgi:hypothetical protein